jgi:hypothetical protein
MQIESSVGGWHSERTRRFLRHLLEMTVAMMLGMCVLGAAFGVLHVVVFGSGFAAAWQRHVELAAFAMAFNMTLPMLLWMRHRGHSWERGGEMATAMVVPALALLVLFWLGVIPEGPVVPLQMALMLPAMILLMLYRADEYSAAHAPTAPGRRRWFAHAG